MKKILFATIVPFWNRETGAQQRIFSLVQVLEEHGHQVRIFFPGHAEPTDRELAKQLSLDISFHSSDQPLTTNQSLSEKLKWQFDAVVHALQGQATDDRVDSPLKLSDFRWPWAEKAFQNLVKEFAPEAIVCEYITMAYLVAALKDDQRARIHCLVDTHDLLSQRQQQFAVNNRSHWINISSEEESSAFKTFDTIMAIQPDEAIAIESLTPDKNVIVVGHQPYLASTNHRPSPRQESAKLSLGYIGSDNDSNTDAINQFLDLVWKHFKDDVNLTLTIAGNVSERIIDEYRQFKNVKILGRVSDLETFYESVDAMINPVTYGTGLKIKSVEAIAFARPLLCTTAAWIGDPIGGVIVVNSLQDMEKIIKGWLSEPGIFENAKSAAATSSQKQSDQTYAPLLELLKHLQPPSNADKR